LPKLFINTRNKLNYTLSQIKNKVSALYSKLLGLKTGIINHGDTNLFEKGAYTQKKDTLQYRILFPDGFDPIKKYPLVFMLHGSGERGNDNNAQLANGASLFLDSRERYPAIVVFPQCSKNGYWSNVHLSYEANGNEHLDFQIGGEPTRDMSLLLGAVDEFLNRPYVDKNRVYLGGLSMGGMGTLELLRRRTDVFAAAFCICGGDNGFNAKAYAQNVPLWIFHGENDNVVAASYSESIVTAIEEFGGKPRFTLYKGVGHDSWTNAFAEPELLPWLFGNSK
jgi:predicted peptidase